MQREVVLTFRGKVSVVRTVLAEARRERRDVGRVGAHRNMSERRRDGGQRASLPTRCSLGERGRAQQHAGTGPEMADMSAGVARGLVEPQRGNEPGHVGSKPDAQFERPAVVRGGIRRRRQRRPEAARARRRCRRTDARRGLIRRRQGRLEIAVVVDRARLDDRRALCRWRPRVRPAFTARCRMPRHAVVDRYFHAGDDSQERRCAVRIDAEVLCRSSDSRRRSHSELRRHGEDRGRRRREVVGCRCCDQTDEQTARLHTHVGEQVHRRLLHAHIGNRRKISIVIAVQPPDELDRSGAEYQRGIRRVHVAIERQVMSRRRRGVVVPVVDDVFRVRHRCR